MITENELTLERMEQLDEILIIPYSHTDFAWTNTRDWHKTRYIAGFCKALDIMKTNPTFTFGLDNVAHSLRVLEEGCPERMDEIRARIKEGRFYVANGGYSLARPNCVGDEAYVRNIVAGKKSLQNKLTGGEELSFFFNADTAVGHTQMPQLLQLSGHKYYASSRPDEVMTQKGMPRQFVWKGLDGSKITYYRGDYGGFLMTDYMEKLGVDWQAVKEGFFENELKNRMRLCSVNKVMHFYGGDDILPFKNVFDQEVPLEAFIEEWNKREKPKMRFATPEEYFTYLDSQQLPEVEGVLDNCDLSYNSPNKGDDSFWRQRFEMNDLIPALEVLCSIANMYGIPYPEAKLDEIWKRHFEITGHAIEYILKEDYEYLQSKARENHYAVKNMLCDVTKSLARRVGTGSPDEYIFFNTHSFEVTQTVKLHLAHHDGVRTFKVVDAFDQELEFQVIETYTGDKCPDDHVNSMDVLVQLTVPAFSFASAIVKHTGGTTPSEYEERTYHIVAGKEPRDHRDRVVIDNGCMTVTLEREKLVSIVTAEGKTITASDGNLTHITFDKTTPTVGWIGGWSVEKEYDFTAEDAILLKNGPIEWKYQVTGTLFGSSAKQTVTIRKNDSVIDFDLELISDGKEGYFTAGFDCDPQTPIRADIPYGVEPRDLKSAAWYALQQKDTQVIPCISQEFKGQFYGRTFVTFEKQNHPFAFISRNCSIYYRWSEEKGKIDILLHRNYELHADERTDGRRDVWFKQCPGAFEGKGKHKFSYSLMVRSEKAENDLDVIQASKSRRVKLFGARRFNSSEAILAKPAIRCDCDHVIFTALYRQDGVWYTRFYEAEGKSDTITVATDLPISSMEKVDLLGRSCNPALFTAESRIQMNIRPWEIVTVRLIPSQTNSKERE